MRMRVDCAKRARLAERVLDNPSPAQMLSIVSMGWRNLRLFMNLLRTCANREESAWFYSHASATFEVVPSKDSDPCTLVVSFFGTRQSFPKVPGFNPSLKTFAPFPTFSQTDSKIND